jgi:TonB-linked SusC/RagA family outer membrane protein
MTYQRVLFLLFVLLCGSVAFGQEHTIKGKITDDKAAPVVGATVKIKGTNIATSTKQDGSFSLPSSSPTVTLVISSVGFATKEVPASEGIVLGILLQGDSKQLGEVVVTALGINRQAKTLTYATQTIRPQQLTEVRDPNNVLNSLAGKVANAVITQGSGGPGSGARIVLRGSRSIQSSNNALIVVDGVPISNNTYSAAMSDFGSIQGSDGASSINPDDIESMTILRGASAAALYGSEAANGVIVITTKKGSKDKISVMVNSGVVLENAWSLEKVQNTYGQGIGGTFNDSTQGASWGPKMAGQQYTDWLGKSATYSPQPNNIKDFFNTGSSFNNSIDVSGGSDKAQTYASYTNNTVNGIVPGNSMNRHTITLRVTNQVNKWFSTDAKVTYVNQDIKNRPRTGEENSPTMDIYNIPRNVSTAQAEQYQYINNVGVPTAYGNYPSTKVGIYQDPYWLVHNTSLNETRNRVTGFLSAKFTFTPWLSFTTRGNLDRILDKEYATNYQSTPLWAPNAGGYYAEQNIETSQKWFDGIFEGNNKIGEDWKIIYHAGAIYEDKMYTVTTNKADGLLVTNKFSLNYASTPSMDVSGQHVQTQAVFGQASVGYKDGLFLDGSFRNEWDSRLGPPYTYQYYSIGGSAVISDLIHNLPDAISYLKASLSYAQVGNGGKFGLLVNSYDFSQGAGNGFLTRGTTLPFPDLKPEITKSYEANIEAKFLNDRLGIAATVYKSNSSNQLLQLQLPVATGYQYQYINAGNIQNKGLELVINATPVKRRDLTWDINVNFGLNRNKVISLSPDIKVTYLAGGFGRSATPQVAEGGSYGDLLGYQWAKNDKGQYLVHTSSPQPYSGLPITTDKVTGAQQTYLGNFMPRETLGMTNTFRYKKFNLRVLIDGRIGGIIVDGTEMNLAFSGIPEVTSKYRDGGINLGGVDSSGKAVNVPLTAQQFWMTASQQRYGVAQFFTYDATNFRLRELTLGYDLPVKSTPAIKSARISFIARNVLWIYRGKSILDIPSIGKRTMSFDPDMSLGNDNYQGVSYGTLPATRSYGVNLQLTF